MQSLIIGFIAMATVQSWSHVVFDCKAPDEIWDKVPEVRGFVKVATSLILLCPLHSLRLKICLCDAKLMFLL
jgi:hypothetical protein